MVGKVIGAKDSDNSTAKADVFSFEANKLQLTGPVPPELHHNFVGFAPFVTAYFTRSGLRGRVLNRALHGQYNHLYCHDQSTEYGCIDNAAEGRDSNALAKKFLEMVHWNDGYRTFTYVITLDAEWRFTETGDEFAIDLLSKHSLHSDVSRVIAYSGEFFVRRSHHHDHIHGEAYEVSTEKSGKEQNKEKQDDEKENAEHETQKDGCADAITSEPSHKRSTIDHNPAHYELIIDNDSGTYRPKKDYLPQLKSFLESNLHGIGEITIYDCFDKNLEKLKHDRKEAKQHGGRRVFRQRSISSNGSSISSSDVEELDTGREKNIFKRIWGKWMMGDVGGGR